MPPRAHEYYESPMVLIRPPESPNVEEAFAMKLLQRLGTTLATKSARQMLDDCIRNTPSVRRIQTGRYEIFVSDAMDKGSACLDKILKRNHFPANTKTILCDYARRQALQDGRIPPNSIFGNFSIILTYGKVDQQAPHIDLLAPNFQFGLLLTNDSRGTLVYLIACDLETVYDLKKLWNEWNASDDDDAVALSDMPPSLIRAFEQSKDATRLLKDYGKVLVPEEQMTRVEIDQKELSSGALLSLPGSVMHAGPDAVRARAVLFFSSCPDTHEVAEYNPDDQYSAVFLAGQLTTLLWRMAGVGAVEREYLLRVLLKYMQQSPVKRKWAHHFPYGGFSLFMQQVERADAFSASELDSLVQTTSRNDALCFFNVEGDFDVVSVNNLLTIWEGAELELVVYRRESDNMILVKYPSDLSWEGGKPGERYALEMIVPTEKFNGVNGRLLDADGDEIKCYCRKEGRSGKRRKQSTAVHS